MSSSMFNTKDNENISYSDKNITNNSIELEEKLKVEQSKKNKKILLLYNNQYYNKFDQKTISPLNYQGKTFDELID